MVDLIQEEPKTCFFSDVTNFTLEKQKKPKYCEDCPYYENRQGLEEPPPDVPLDIMIVYGCPDNYLVAPTRENIQSLFNPKEKGSQHWKLFKRAISCIQNKQLTVRAYAAVLCSKVYENKLPARVVSKCSRYLKMKIDELKPKVIIAMGNQALRALKYKPTITKVRGQIARLPGREDGPWVIPTYSFQKFFEPDTYEKAYKLISILRLDFEKAIHVVRNGFIPFHPDLFKDQLVFPETEEQICELLKQWTGKSEEVVSYDIETTGLNPRKPNQEIIAFSIGWKEGSSFKAAAFSTRGASQKVWEAIRIFLESTTLKTGHYIQFDNSWLKALHKIPVNGLVGDTLLRQYLIDDNRSGNADENEKRLAGEYSQDRLVWDYLPQFGGYKDFERVSPLIKEGRILEVPLPALLRYSALDALTNRYLYAVQTKLLNDFSPTDTLPPQIQETKLSKLSRTLLVKAVPLLVNLESRGICIDINYLDSSEKEATRLLGEFEEQVYHLAGKRFKINSYPAKADLLYKQMGLIPLRWTKKKQPSVDEEALLPYAEKYPIIPALLSYLKIDKLLSTFYGKIRSLLEPDGRVHPRYNLDTTTTGRLSCEEPNIQQMTESVKAGKLLDKKTGKYEHQFEVKKLFIPSPGRIMLQADYSQIEVAILACYSKDSKLIAALIEGKDVHSFVASQIFEVPYEQFVAAVKAGEEPYVTQRRNTKAITFGIIYGSTAWGLAKKQGWELEFAERIFSTFMNTFPGTQRYISQVHSLAKKHYYVESMFHRRRRFPILEWTTHNALLRQAQNSPIQSTASDLTLSASIRLEEELSKLGGNVLMTVHDSIGSEVPHDPSLIRKARDLYQQILVEEPASEHKWLRVPLRIDLTVGPSWGELQPVE